MEDEEEIIDEEVEDEEEEQPEDEKEKDANLGIDAKIDQVLSLLAELKDFIKPKEEKANEDINY